MKTNKSFTINIPISKIDEEQRIVTGIATTEALDSQGDIVDYEASKKAFTEWGGNIREMHGSTAVGKSIDIQFDDINKQVVVSSFISESADGQNAWTKIKEGILTGYSIGGRMLEVVKDKAVDGANRIMDYALSEVSLVDRPANPEAEFVMVKSFDGKLNQVEVLKDNNKLPDSWWMEKFMSTKQIKKSVYDAGQAVSLATQLSYLIMMEQDEPDQVADLTTAFNALRDFIGKEVAEGDDFDWQTEYATVIELAEKAIDLRKGTEMVKDLTKNNVIGGEERDETATATNEVVEPTTEETPVSTTEEVLAGPVIPAPVEVPVETPAEPVVEPTPEVVAEPVVETPAEPIVEVPVETPVEPVVETPVDAPVDAPTVDAPVDESAKADGIANLAKNVETLLAKLNDTKSGDSLTKMVSDEITKMNDKVEKQFASLEGRVKAIENQPLPTKAKSSYTTVAKGDSEVSTDMDAILKRQEELIANPYDAKPGEAEAIAKAIRNAPKN